MWSSPAGRGRKRPCRGEIGPVAGGRGSRTGSRPRARAATAVVPFRRNALPRASRRGRARTGDLPRAEHAGGRLELDRIAPSGRSILAGLLILVAAVGAYALARETSAFAVDEVAVEGAPPTVAADVRKALKPALGESLLVVDLDRLERAVIGVPMVASVGFDRAFPHTLRVTVVPEVPAAVLRQGARSWLAAAGGKIVSELDRGARPALPRIWLGRGADIRVGERLTGQPFASVRAVAPLAATPLPSRVASVRASAKELTLVLRSGVELRLGDGSDRDVKLEVARRILPLLGSRSGYLDVSVPQRPVAADTLDSQVEVETKPSTTP
jgi:cell division protein FtsQ